MCVCVLHYGCLAETWSVLVQNHVNPEGWCLCLDTQGKFMHHYVPKAPMQHRVLYSSPFLFYYVATQIRVKDHEQKCCWPLVPSLNNPPQTLFFLITCWLLCIYTVLTEQYNWIKKASRSCFDLNYINFHMNRLISFQSCLLVMRF